MIEVEELLQDVSEDAPCGEDLEYDEAFIALEQAAQGKPEQQVGDSIIPAEEPDWRDVQKTALALFERTRDLRVAMYLARALVNTEGFPGLRDGLAVLRGLIERHWEGVHPRLDPDDDNDPTMRVNILSSLCDEDAVLRHMRHAPLVSSRAIGRFSMRDLAVASGELSPSEDEEAAPPAMSAIDAAFMDVDLEELQATADAVAESTEHVVAIEASLTEQVGAANAADFNAATSLLRDVGRILNEQLGRRGVGEGEVAEGEQGAAEGGGAAAPAQRIAGQIGSREDVIRAIDMICRWYERAEPSSPVPLLLTRAKRLVTMSFMEIVKDMAPDGVADVEKISGQSATEESEEY